MNMMFSCLFGVGFVLVRYRKNGVLKRMKATPVSPLNFVSAQAVSRLMIVLITSVVVFSGTNLFLRFVMKGSWLNLLLLTALSIMCMIALGLVFASRIKSEELASGLLNLVTFPMLILSGVFFSLGKRAALRGHRRKDFPADPFHRRGPGDNARRGRNRSRRPEHALPAGPYRGFPGHSQHYVQMGVNSPQRMAE
jgi:hypothetical protein